MSGIRAQQKEKTRRQIIDAALGQLSAERSFSSLSLREVAKEAGLAPTSFYRHFSDMDELGLTLVDEAGLTLRQLMRQARQRIEKGGSVVKISVVTFMEFLESNGNIFRLPATRWCVLSKGTALLHVMLQHHVARSEKGKRTCSASTSDSTSQSWGAES